MTKIIKNFTYEVKDKYDNVITVYARIEKEGERYYWYTSHRTKPQDSDAVGIYHASNVESTLNSAIGRVNVYIDMMRRSKVVVPNEYY